MHWNTFKDANQVEIGKVHTQIAIKARQIIVITKVELKAAKGNWIDTNIVDRG